MLQLLIGPITNIAGTWLKGKQEKAAAKAKLEVAKVEATVKKVQQDGDWEAQAMSASDSSWKDEAWTILFIIIIAMCFIPPLQPYTERGFDALSRTPQWFQFAMYGAIASSFGLRGMGKVLGKK